MNPFDRIDVQKAGRTILRTFKRKRAIMSGTTYSVYDKVWRMYNNKPTEYTVFAVRMEMSYYRNGVDVKYVIIDETGNEMGHGVQSSARITVTEDEVFDTKVELLRSL